MREKRKRKKTERFLGAAMRWIFMEIAKYLHEASLG